MDSVLPTFAGLQLASMHEQQRGANGGRGPGRPRHNSQADVLTDEDPVVWLNRCGGKCGQSLWCSLHEVHPKGHHTGGHGWATCVLHFERRVVTDSLLSA